MAETTKRLRKSHLLFFSLPPCTNMKHNTLLCQCQWGCAWRSLNFIELKPAILTHFSVLCFAFVFEVGFVFFPSVKKHSAAATHVAVNPTFLASSDNAAKQL